MIKINEVFEISQKKFAQRFSELMHGEYLTILACAKDLGIAPSTVSHWLTGTFLPEGKYLLKIALLFNVPVDYLLGLTNDKEVY